MLTSLVVMMIKKVVEMLVIKTVRMLTNKVKLVVSKQSRHKLITSYCGIV